MKLKIKLNIDAEVRFWKFSDSIPTILDITVQGKDCEFYRWNLPDEVVDSYDELLADEIEKKRISNESSIKKPLCFEFETELPDDCGDVYLCGDEDKNEEGYYPIRKEIKRGITQLELKQFFSDKIKLMAVNSDLTVDTCFCNDGFFDIVFSNIEISLDDIIFNTTNAKLEIFQDWGQGR